MATKKTVNKAEWIRKHPNASAADLIALAKKEGFAITAAQVYTTRSDAKKKSGSAPAKRGPGRPPAQQSTGSGGSIDAMIRTIVRDEIRKYFTER